MAATNKQTSTELDQAAGYRLDDRIAKTTGRVAMTGIQAIIRVPLDQKRLDERNGLTTAGLICGYRGSPVGGMDQAYEQDRAHLEPNNIRFISGVNEDLAATAIWGTQQTALEGNPLFDGVTGLWYGKGPGVDRTGDVFRHANTSGVHPYGGVLAVAGDDPACKSSTIASASEWSLADLAMPTLYPSSVQDVLDFGLAGYAMSRFSGAWVGLKLHTNVADSYTSVDLALDRFQIAPAEFLVDGVPFRHRQSNTLIAPTSLHLEEEMFGNRLEAAKAFHAAQSFDKMFGATESTATVGIVCAGPVYGELRDTLLNLGFGSDEELEQLGIRLYKPAMIWPLEPSGLHRFAAGLQEIIVIEEKRAFLETQIRDLLYQRVVRNSGQTDSSAALPNVLGKRSADGSPMFAAHGGLLAEDLMAPLRKALGRHVAANRFTRERIPVLIAQSGAAQDVQTRSAYFCSGCPHNRSTVLPDGSRGHGGIGCHTMSLNMDREVFGVTHMGGEGSQWVGMAPFVSDSHRFQNIGDGTLAHSGSLAIRQAVSAGTNITYKILYNGTVAMTGGQDAAGNIEVPELTHWLQAEGVAKTIVVADDPKKYGSGASFAKNSSVVHRDKLDQTQRSLRAISGTTVLIYDQACAAELRRGRKRGTIETPTTRVMIDASICEGCGDCGAVSNCASVHPVQTPLGRKTQIHQESCNYDLTCLEGNCPAFLTVEIDSEDNPKSQAAAGADAVRQVLETELPPDPARPTQGSILLVGIGGTGVVTVNQVLSTAALLDGNYSTGLDQTGLAQKGGSVVSNVRITTSLAAASNRVGTGGADTLLVFDLLTAMTNLDRCDSTRTTAVVSTGLVPTGNMAAGRASEEFPELRHFSDSIGAVTRAANNVWLDATAIATNAFASQPAANLLVVGVAYQRGLLPVSGASIEQAISLNGVAVQMNLDAFRLGRHLVSDTALMQTLSGPQSLSSPQSNVGPGADGPSSEEALFAALSPDVQSVANNIAGSDDLQEIVRLRLPYLVDYQDLPYARRYGEFIADLARSEENLLATDNQYELTRTVARHLFKLMAYKDEFEVARLALNSDAAQLARDRFGQNTSIKYKLEPPSIKRFGLSKKIGVPEAAARRGFQGLAKAKKLRGTRFDPFARNEDRQLERALIGEYENLVADLLTSLRLDTSPANVENVTQIADLADQIRGFAEVKAANVVRYREAVSLQLSRLVQR